MTKYITEYNGVQFMDKTGREKIKQLEQYKDIVNKKIYQFDSVNSMKSYNLKENDVCQTLGYYKPNDGGGASYLIVSDKTLYNKNWIESLHNKLFAVLINDTPDELNAKQCGMKGNGIDDDSDIFDKVLALTKDKKIYFPYGKYMFFKPIVSHVATNYIIGEDINPLKPIYDTVIFDFTKCEQENINLLEFGNITMKNILIQSNSYSLEVNRTKALSGEDPFTEHINKTGINGLVIKSPNSVLESVKIVGCSETGLKVDSYNLIDNIKIEHCKSGFYTIGDNQIGKIRVTQCYGGIDLRGPTNHITDIRMDDIYNGALNVYNTGNYIACMNVDYCYGTCLTMYGCYNLDITLFMSRVGVSEAKNLNEPLTFDNPSSIKGYPVVMYKDCINNNLNITLKRGKIMDDDSTELSAPIWGILGYNGDTYKNNNIKIKTDIIDNINDKISLKHIMNNLGYNGYLTVNSNNYLFENLALDDNLSTCFKINDKIAKSKNFFSNVDVFEVLNKDLEFKIIEFGENLTNSPDTSTYFVCLKMYHRAVAFTENGIYLSRFSSGKWNQWNKISTI